MMCAVVKINCGAKGTHTNPHKTHVVYLIANNKVNVKTNDLHYSLKSKFLISSLDLLNGLDTLPRC